MQTFKKLHPFLPSLEGTEEKQALSPLRFTLSLCGYFCWRGWVRTQFPADPPISCESTPDQQRTANLFHDCSSCLMKSEHIPDWLGVWFQNKFKCRIGLLKNSQHPKWAAFELPPSKHFKCLTVYKNCANGTMPTEKLYCYSKAWTGFFFFFRKASLLLSRTPNMLCVQFSLKETVYKHYCILYFLKV